MNRKLFAVATLVIVGIQNSYGITGGVFSNELFNAEQWANPANVAGGASDPTIAYSQPAGLGDIGKANYTAGGVFEVYQIERTGTDGVSHKTASETVFVPSVGASWSFMEGKLGFGLAVVSPYGLKMDWGETSPVRYLATQSTIEMIDLTPAVSYRHNDKLAVGFGVDYFKVTDASLQRKFVPDVVNVVIATAQGLNPLLFLTGAGDGNLKLEGDGDQWGYHAGFLYDPTEKHGFGIAYHSEVKMELEGTVELTGLSGIGATSFGGTNINTPATADLFFPQNVLMGYAFKPNETWRFELDAHWFDWSSNKRLVAKTPNISAGLRPILEDPLPLEWKDVWSFAFGTTFTQSESWRWNGGLFYIPEAIPEQNYSPAIPESVRWGFTFGPTYTRGGFSVNTMYNPLIYTDRSVSNNLGPETAGVAAADIDGEFSADIIHIFGLNVNYRFN